MPFDPGGPWEHEVTTVTLHAGLWGHEFFDHQEAATWFDQCPGIDARTAARFRDAGIPPNLAAQRPKWMFDSGQRRGVDGACILRFHVRDRSAVDERLRAEAPWVSWPPWGDRQCELFCDIYSSHADLMRRALPRHTRLRVHGVGWPAMATAGGRSVGTDLNSMPAHGQ
jgi:hypothetical protein